VFVCFEGIDGAGKSTQARMLYQRLKAEGRPTELVADPGTTSIGTAIRQILLQNDAPITTLAQMLLFSAARAELAAHIKARLADGVTVICDRWLLSTLVYQGELNGVDPELIMAIFRGTSNITPDLCLLLDLPDAVVAARVGPPRDRYERRSFADLWRTRNAYFQHAKNPLAAKRLCQVNAAQTFEALHEEVYRLYSNTTRSLACQSWRP